MTLLGIDVSHHQGAVDFAAVKRAGNAFVIVKATEGVGYVDPNFATYRKQASAAGLVVGFYHFARAGDPVAEADWFCKTVGALAVGDLVILDWETKTANPPAWCRAWLDRVAAVLGVRPLIYMNQSTRDGFDWSPVVSGNYGLWVAQYDGNLSVPASGKWPTVALKQFTDKQTVPGVAGGVDADVFYGDAKTLAAYGFQGEDMPLNAADEALVIKAVWSDSYATIGGARVPFGLLLRSAYDNSKAAAIDAAVARKLTEQLVAGVTLSPAQVADIAAKAAADVAASIEAGYELHLEPKPANPTA